MPNYRVELEFVSGSNLMAADRNGFSDPYLKAFVGNRSYETKVIDKTLNPEWKELWIIQAVPFGSVLWIEVFDKDKATHDDSLGEAKLKLEESVITKPGETMEFNLPVLFKGKEHGSLKVLVKATPGAITLDGPPHHYRVNVSRMAGAIAHRGAGERSTISPKFSTWQVELLNVPKHFGEARQGWNKNYEAAQKIFGDGTKSKSIRGAIRTQHRLVYGDGTRTFEGNIFNGEDFLNLINHGKRDSKTPFFTYAIAVDKKDPTRYFIRFSETGANFGKDFFSKHAMHANARTEVVFSGEFHVQHEADRYRLVIDNNSGTYSPDKNLLPNLRALMAEEFPGLDVEALDFGDPKLKGYKEAMKKK